MPFATSIGTRRAPRLLGVACVLAAAGCTCAPARGGDKVTVETLLHEMIDFDELARRPDPPYTTAAATSYNRACRAGGDLWFSNGDYDQFVRTETSHGRTEQVLADLVGPGAVTRIWTADAALSDHLRFYFDGEDAPRVDARLIDLFGGRTYPLVPELAYTVAGGGNLYFPFPYERSLKITREPARGRPPEKFYYQVAYRTYDAGTRVETYDARQARSWESAAIDAASELARPSSGAPFRSDWVTEVLSVPPGETRSVHLTGEKAVFEWSARVLSTREGGRWDDPLRADNAYRFLLLGIDFDGEPGVRVPLGDFFGSGPGVKPYENRFFTVEGNGRMTSRLRMTFREAMTLSLTNAGPVTHEVDVRVHAANRRSTSRDYRLSAEWGVLSHDTWPRFDMTFLDKKGEGKIVGSVYEIANPVLVWWGEGNQKIFVDGESFPSTFGTGTEDDYGFAFARGDLFGRPFHAQTRVDGPRNGGLVSMNRVLALDAIPFHKAIRYDEEVWHWVPCRPTFGHVVYWYAERGAPGPAEIDRATLAPVDLGRPEDMLSFEGETTAREVTGGVASVESVDSCSDAEELVWRGSKPGDSITVHFSVPRAGRYLARVSLGQGPAHARVRLTIDGGPGDAEFDGYAAKTYWQQPTVGVFDLREGDNTLEARVLEPDPRAAPGNEVGLDYIVLTKL